MKQNCVSASCWMISKPPSCSHFWNIYQPNYYPQRYLIHSHFEWFAIEQTCLLQVFISYNLFDLVVFIKKIKFLSLFPNLEIFLKFFVPCKDIQLHYVWCHCNDFYFHTSFNLCQSSGQSPSCVFIMLEIIFYIHLWPKIQIKHISHVFFVGQIYHAFIKS